MSTHFQVINKQKKVSLPFTPTSFSPDTPLVDSTYVAFYTSGAKPLAHWQYDATVTGIYQALAVVKNQDGKSVRRIFEPPGIVYKIVSGEKAIRELRTEANLYCKQLKTLQGKFVPIFRGYFQGKLADGTEAECIVVSSSGMTSIGRLRMPEDDNLFRARIKQAWVDALIEIHKAGVQYGDSLPRMMITKDLNTPEIMRIANFGTATTGHSNCQGLGRESSSYKAHTTLAVGPDDCCPELWRFCQIIRFWAPPNVVYDNNSFPVDPDFDVGKLVQRAGIQSVSEYWSEAFQCYIDYTKAWGPETRYQELLKEQAEWEKQNTSPAVDDVQVERTEQ